jgi:hypothetical protein
MQQSVLLSVSRGLLVASIEGYQSLSHVARVFGKGSTKFKAMNDFEQTNGERISDESSPFQTS